jgi:hypothetical protein
MNKVLRALVAFGLCQLTSALRADFTLDLGTITSGQQFTLAVSSPTDSDSTFEIVDSNDQVVVSGSIQAVYTGAAPENYDYITCATPHISGVTIGHSGYRNTDIDVFGLPTGNYRLKSYTPWGNSSTFVQTYGPYYWGGTTNFGSVDEYGSSLVFFDMFIY